MELKQFSISDELAAANALGKETYLKHQIFSEIEMEFLFSFIYQIALDIFYQSFTKIFS